MNAEDSVRVRLGVAVLALRRALLPSYTESSHRVSLQGSKVQVCAGVLCSNGVGSRESGVELDLMSRTGARLTTDSLSGACSGLVLQVGSTELNVKPMLQESSLKLLWHSCTELLLAAVWLHACGDLEHGADLS